MRLPEQPVAGFFQALNSAAFPPVVEGLADVDQRFNVYRNNVAVSLNKALAQRFPVIERLLGQDYFTALAREFVAAQPPSSPVLMTWGQEFSGFLDRFPPLAGYPYLSDVARIEWARGVAFHAADHVPLDGQAVANLVPETDGLQLHPSVIVLRSMYPAVSIWQKRPDDKAAITAGPEIALVLRDRGFDVPVHRITAQETAFLDAIKRGDALLDATLAASSDENFDPQPLLVLLMQAGALI